MTKLKYKYEYKDRTIEGVMEIDLSRVKNNIRFAQYGLDSMIMTDMVPYMPSRTNAFVNLVRARSAARSNFK